MSVTQPPPVVLLPGTGSDDAFVRRVFADAVAASGARLLTPPPRPGSSLVSGYVEALDDAASDGPVVVGGISLGAHVAAAWAVRRPDRCAGLLVALPGWVGEPGDAPAAVAARYSAADIRARGLPTALAAAVDGVPGWLAAELTRAWSGHGTGLADSLLVAAGTPAPTAAELSGLAVPAGVAACVDDPIHPIEVAETWASALPGARLGRTSLVEVGRDPAVLGRTAVAAWRRAGNSSHHSQK